MTSKAVNNNKSKSVPDSKGKGKDAVVKPGKSTGATTAATRVPLRAISTRSKNINDDGTSIAHPKKPAPVVEIPATSDATRRATTRTAISTSTITRKITVHKKAPSIEEVEQEEEPLHKKRRTSSEVGDEIQLETIDEEHDLVSEAVLEPENAVVEEQDWDDLDREDDDDPLMVSEYVVEIFNYLKVVEVSCSGSLIYYS